MRQGHIQEKRAFTLMELIFVMLIIGVLTSLAIPRFSDTMEKSRIAEAINILEALRNAQEIYNHENGVYTADPDDLDITIPPPQNFEMPTVGVSDPIASIQRAAAAAYDYTLTIDADGTVRCSGTAPAGICARLGCSGGAGDECN